MKTKRTLSIIGAVLAILIITSVALGQYAGYYMGTAYQLVNTSGGLVTIDIDYVDANGVIQTAAHRQFVDVEAGGSRLVIVPKDETNLGPGSYSAVVSSTGSIAGIVNEEFYPTGNTTNPHPPFASYSAADTGASTVYLPAVMYNYYNYFTELYIQNIDSTDAADVQIEYIPGTVNNIVYGAHVGPVTLATIKPYATLKVSQQAMTELGGATGRFFGAAKITSASGHPLVVVANEHNLIQTKLMAYNGIIAPSTSMIAPTAMRGWFTYYTALTVSNTSATSKACVRLTYNADMSQAASLTRTDGLAKDAPITVEYSVDPQNALLRYEGPVATASQSDLMAHFSRFTGSVTVESFAGTVGGVACTQQPLAAIMNVEAMGGVRSQAGSFNPIPTTSASGTIIAPVVLANYYKYYTTMVIANTTATPATCRITYTAGPNSAVASGTSHFYDRPLAANGSMMIYEGNPISPDSRSDLNAHVADWGGTGGVVKFIGSATIVCKDAATSTNPVPVVAIVNEEVDTAGMDSMYTMNTINQP